MKKKIVFCTIIAVLIGTGTGTYFFLKRKMKRRHRKKALKEVC